MTDLYAQLFHQHGPLMGGEDLRRSLGFKTADSFERAVRLGKVGVKLFPIEGRRGKFALTSDVAEWLVAQRNNAPTSKTRRPPMT